MARVLSIVLWLLLEGCSIANATNNGREGMLRSIQSLRTLVSTTNATRGLRDAAASLRVQSSRAYSSLTTLIAPQGKQYLI